MTARAIYSLATGEIVRVRPEQGAQVTPPAGCGVVDITGCTGLGDVKQRSVNTGTVVSGGTYALADATFPKRCELRVTKLTNPKVGGNFTLQVKAYDGDGVARGAVRSYRLRVVWGSDVVVDEEDATNASGTRTRVVSVPGSRPLRGGKEQPYSLVAMVRPLGTCERGGSHRMEVED